MGDLPGVEFLVETRTVWLKASPPGIQIRTTCGGRYLHPKWGEVVWKFAHFLDNQHSGDFVLWGGAVQGPPVGSTREGYEGPSQLVDLRASRCQNFFLTPFYMVFCLEKVVDVGKTGWLVVDLGIRGGLGTPPG